MSLTKELIRLYRMDQPYPVGTVVRRLIEAADHLRFHHNCDCHAHEGVAEVVRIALEWLPSIPDSYVALEKGIQALEQSVEELSDALTLCIESRQILRQRVADLEEAIEDWKNSGHTEMCKLVTSRSALGKPQSSMYYGMKVYCDCGLDDAVELLKKDKT